MDESSGMNYCDVTKATAAENLAYDEALLQSAEEGVGDEVLRVWEPADYFVVAGYGNKVAAEVHLPFCKMNKIPVLRRCSGGGTILQGKGCLNYALVLRSSEAAHLASIAATNHFIMERHRAAFAALLRTPVQVKGHTDLTLRGRKFSGNAQKRGKHWLLFHGTFLLDLEIPMVQQTLNFPSRQPEYRSNRAHTDFIVNLKIPAAKVKEVLRKSWNATERVAEIPTERINALVHEKYGRDEWNLRL